MGDTTRIPIDFTSPAISHDVGNSFYTVTPLTAATPDFDLGHWEMTHTGDVDSYIYGTVTVPNTIGGTPAAKIVLLACADQTATANVRTRVATSAKANGEVIDAALTAETEQTTAMPTAAFELEEISYTLTNAPAAKDEILVEFRREASDTTNDTMAANLIIVKGFLEIDLS